MTNEELIRRIHAAKDRLNSLPQWVRDNNRFQGGYTYRENKMSDYVKFEDLMGKTLTSIVRAEDDDHLIFTTESGEKYAMYHSQDCCEHVYIEDVCGDLDDLIGEPILEAEEVTHRDETPEGISLPGHDDSYTWTFYKLATKKGFVTLRWFGSSNGYYSESVRFTLMS